ncbi:hypothetical protein ER578_13600 [Enterococcus faecium]|uniref:PH domain-containing protein n=2 Tax=Enterococcus faecium TaxID=1352 RepID=A0AB73N4V4_ENTFC|nr:hypothetical protein [Enterococcus faecium]EGP5130062.1 hypothetical protein [Enterococcus faecium]EME3511294.1 hypothetical protein [Enterococcus faecium]EME3544751.1 hypothetical protein [Enterococcus faecium]EME8119382.1 hypothetical protein [Enterococcus faecium]EME8193967.1 hypothetical protein [Enterococcus faecium]
MIKLIGKDTLKVYYVAETKAEVSRWLLKMFSKTRTNAAVSQKASTSETGMPEAMWISRRN